MILRADWTKVKTFRPNLCLQIRYLKERHAVAARLQLMRQCEERIYVTGNGWPNDTEASQLPGDRTDA